MELLPVDIGKEAGFTLDWSLANRKSRTHGKFCLQRKKGSIYLLNVDLI